jgi:serine protease Do
LKLVGAALIFGVVAGVAFTGVTTVKDHFTSSTKSTQRIETTVAADDSDSSSSSTSASAQDVSSIVSNVMPSVVSITGTFQTSSYFGLGTQESQGAGSGFIIADDDDNLMIATNNHVVEDAKSLTVGFCDDSTAEATIVGTDSDADLAVISVKKTDVSEDTLSQIKVATLGSSDDLKVGEAVIAIGNALGYGQSVTTGVVSAKDREVSFTDGTMVLLQTDAAINPGNSGGVLVNLKGQVIGINNAKLEDTSVEGMGYAIPISTASTLLNDLMNAGSISEKDAAFLGIVGKTIDSTYSEALGMPSGIYVSQVVTDSPAEKAGISAGDVITEFEGNKISTMTGLKEKLALKKADTKVKITLQRANQNGEYEEQTIEVTLGKQSDYADVTTDNTDSSDSSDNNSNSSTQNESDGNNSSNPYEDYYGNGNSNGGSFNPYYYFFNN